MKIKVIKHTERVMTEEEFKLYAWRLPQLFFWASPFKLLAFQPQEFSSSDGLGTATTTLTVEKE